MKQEVYHSAVALLKQLIATPSFSREEGNAANVLEKFMFDQGLEPQRYLNNVWSKNKDYQPGKFTLLLNSHLDTVKPGTGYGMDPFNPKVEDGKLFGLGSNDAGGCLVSLLAVFRHFYRASLPFNLVFAATAEEEISGMNGVEALLPELPQIDAAIVGEPTKMDMAIAERGLLVVDIAVTGKTGHAARNEGENAIYKALDAITWIRNYCFERESSYLGAVKMAVTSIESPNKAHNVVPDCCNFIVDIRLNELYTHAEVLQILSDNISGVIKPRSTRLKPSFISPEHPLVLAGLQLQRSTYGSPTSSDMALLPVPSLKMGPGDSARSHTPDEFIYLHEIEEGIQVYIDLLNNLCDTLKNKA